LCVGDGEEEAGGGGRRRRQEERQAGNQKQEPHTKMWGTKSTPHIRYFLLIP